MELSKDISLRQCGICADCAPQINGGSGFQNCLEAHVAQQEDDGRAKAIKWVSEGYLLYLIVKHRRPVYRHVNGDISLNKESISAFIDEYLAERNAPGKRMQIYLSLLDFETMENDSSNQSFLVNWGGVPTLNKRGIRLINAMFNRLGFMAEEIDLTNCDELGRKDAQ